MRQLALVLLLGLSPAAAGQDLHRATPLDVLLKRAASSQVQARPHGGGYDDPGDPPGGGTNPAAKTFNISAFRFDYSVTPSPFVVNQGDAVRIVLTAEDDGAGTGHGFFLEVFSEAGNFISPGQSRTIEFVAHTAGTFRFFCTNVCGTGHPSMDGIFTVIPAAVPTGPAIATVTPSRGSTAGGTAITVRGERFASGASVRIGTSAARDVAFVDAGTLTAKVPLGPFDIAGDTAADVVVANPDGQSATLANGFTWTLAAASIESVVPSSGSESGGTPVTIRGAGFTTALPITVRFGSAAATNVTVVDAVTLTASAPPHPLGSVDVVVSVGGTSTAATAAFTYHKGGSRRRSVRH